MAQLYDKEETTEVSLAAVLRTIRPSWKADIWQYIKATPAISVDPRVGSTQLEALAAQREEDLHVFVQEIFVQFRVSWRVHPSRRTAEALADQPRD